MIGRVQSDTRPRITSATEPVSYPEKYLRHNVLDAANAILTPWLGSWTSRMLRQAIGLLFRRAGSELA
jgi:hypothetical protein